MGIYKIVVLKGDGVGPEVACEAVNVIEHIGKKFNHEFQIIEEKIGGEAIDSTGEPLPQQTIKTCKESDAVFLGAIGGHKWDKLPANIRPEAGLLGIRAELGLYANLRPVFIQEALKDSCPLRASIIEKGVDIMVVRELTGGMYFGKRGRYHSPEMGETAFDTEQYSRLEVERIAKVAFEIAMKRNKVVTSIDKANVLESSRFWREVVVELAKEYPQVELNHMYVDNGAMQLIRNPSQFDTILTTNMFGDILSDEASVLAGSIGMLPSASLGENNIGLYEPIHGSAPDIAGQNKANPIASILSVAMMMKYSFNLMEEANLIENAVKSTLEKGYRTVDIKNEETEEYKILGTKEMASMIIKEME
jgi:3-isopropylmalate dehydrogenase